MSKPKRIALYVRVSTDGQTTENQLLELRAVAEWHAWTIDAEYVDHGISGAKIRMGARSSTPCCTRSPGRSSTW